MRAISSHRDIKMRVLILSAAIFACATAAPSGALVTPLAAVVPAVAVNSGDLQAAFIDAKVKTEDLLRAAVDNTREATEQVIEETNDKVIEANDLAKERSLEAFWAGEEKKWQALDAIKTAEAQIDGQVASVSDATAKSLVIPPVVAAPVAPVVAPYYYTPAIVAPGLKAIAPLVAFNAEAPKEEKKEELTKSAEKSEEIKADSVQVESAALKSSEPKPEAPKIESDSKYVVAPAPLVAPVPLTALNLASPWVSSPVFVQPGLKTVATIPYTGQFLAPTVLKTVW